MGLFGRQRWLRVHIVVYSDTSRIYTTTELVYISLLLRPLPPLSLSRLCYLWSIAAANTCPYQYNRMIPLFSFLDTSQKSYNGVIVELPSFPHAVNQERYGKWCKHTYSHIENVDVWWKKIYLSALMTFPVWKSRSAISANILACNDMHYVCENVLLLRHNLLIVTFREFEEKKKTNWSRKWFDIVCMVGYHTYLRCC